MGGNEDETVTHMEGMSVCSSGLFLFSSVPIGSVGTQVAKAYIFKIEGLIITKKQTGIKQLIF